MQNLYDEIVTEREQSKTTKTKKTKTQTIKKTNHKQQNKLVLLGIMVVAAEWPIQHPHFYRGGRGVGRSIILASIMLAAEWPDLAFSLLSW